MQYNFVAEGETEKRACGIADASRDKPGFQLFLLSLLSRLIPGPFIARQALDDLERHPQALSAERHLIGYKTTNIWHTEPKRLALIAPRGNRTH